jgi:hypothetical protein
MKATHDTPFPVHLTKIYLIYIIILLILNNITFINNWFVE